MKYFTALILFIVIFLNSYIPVNAQTIQRSEQFEGQIQSIEHTTEGDQKIQKINVLVTKGTLVNQILTINDLESEHSRKFSVGDTVSIGVSKSLDGSNSYYITDFIRRVPLVILFLIFISLALIIGRKKGISSLLGLGASFLILFYFLIPQLLAGRDPILITLVASICIIPLTFYFAHGFDRKTTAAVIGTLICLVITILIALFFVEAAKLSGFSSDEASFVKMMKGDINIKGLLLAGIIIGLLGVLDDITIAQANVVFQLKHAQDKLSSAQLYSRAMIVGKDHIASMVNTLILVYTGASLPLLLLFTNNDAPFTEVINYEIVAEEIIRTLVSSIGLILAVPITTYIAVLMVNKNPPH